MTPEQIQEIREAWPVRDSTHSEHCYLWRHHHGCATALLCDEVTKLLTENRQLISDLAAAVERENRLKVAIRMHEAAVRETRLLDEFRERLQHDAELWATTNTEDELEVSE